RRALLAVEVLRRDLADRSVSAGSLRRGEESLVPLDPSVEVAVEEPHFFPPCGEVRVRMPGQQRVQPGRSGARNPDPNERRKCHPDRPRTPTGTDANASGSSRSGGAGSRTTDTADTQSGRTSQCYF